MKVGDLVKSSQGTSCIVVDMWRQYEEGSGRSSWTVVVLFPKTGKRRMFCDFELEVICKC